MVLNGDLIHGDEALRIGLVDWVVPDAKLDETTEAVTVEALKSSPTARGFAKKLVTSSFESGFDEAFSRYLDYQQRSLLSDDHKHAMAEYRSRKKQP
jgi:enoyl-CoA hydratase/carnithine racemase